MIAESIGILTGIGGSIVAWRRVINPIIRKEKMKRTERDRKLSEIHQELKFNGGTSLKDVVFQIKKKTDDIEDRLDGMEENQRLVMNLQGIAFWISDEKGECTYASPALCKVMGRSESEIKGNNWAGWLIPEDKARIVEAWHFAIENKTAFDEIYTFRKSDNNMVKVWAQSFPRIAKNNKLGGILGKLVEI